MSKADQLSIVCDYDVILGRCYTQNMGNNQYRSNLPGNRELIRAVSYKHIMVSIDGGQTGNSSLGARHGAVHAASGGPQFSH